jgi:dihydrofolate reductase
MVMPMGGYFDIYNAERLRAASTLLLGRVSFEMFRGFWPAVADDLSQDWSPANREISRLENAIDKVVISDSLTPAQVAPWTNTRIIQRADAYKEIAGLKRQAGKDILVFGSRTLWNDLLAHDLVDDPHLMIGNVVLAGGTPVFSNKLEKQLRLIAIHHWGDSDNVYMQYGVHPQTS